LELFKSGIAGAVKFYGWIAKLNHAEANVKGNQTMCRRESSFLIKKRVLLQDIKLL
jgi:hypothetical protein